MSFEDSDLDHEPRKVFVNKLIFNLRLIEWNLYVTGSLGAAARAIRGTINSLDGETQKKLKKIVEKLETVETSYGSVNRAELEKLHQQFSAFLHQNYLKEAFYAKPRFKTRGTLGDRNNGEE